MKRNIENQNTVPTENGNGQSIDNTIDATPYIIGGGGGSGTDTSKPNWQVSKDNYSKLGAVTVADTWSESITADRNAVVKKSYTKAHVQPAATDYNASVM